jgi:Bifunctional DNA primase/polymerase, N-terminal/AAA domain
VIIEWALHYAEQRGWTVFPLDGETKKPLTWKGERFGPELWGATKDPTLIPDRFAPCPAAGIGIPTGLDNGFWVLETDTKNGKDGEAELANLQAQHSALPTTYKVRSPSGSVHYYFQHPGPDIYITSVSDKVARGVDVKGDGGFVVAPPTLRNGKLYEVIANEHIAEAPEWLLDIVCRKITDQEKRFVKHAPPTDEPTVTQWEIVKLERWVREALSKNLDWFAERENALKTVWAMKRAGYGHEGYRIAQIICEAFPETQHVARIDRFWHDRSAGSGTASLDTFWQMCRDVGIKDTPEERDHWRQDEKAANDADILAKVNGTWSPPLAPDLPPCPVPPQAEQVDLFQTEGEFTAGFVAPDYIVDDIFPQGFLYSITAQTGGGKTAIAVRLMAHIAIGRPFCGYEVKKGQVLYFAGENPTDVQMRWIGLKREMDIIGPVDVHFQQGGRKLTEIVPQIVQEIDRKQLAPLLIIIDTAAAYFPGEAENDNRENGEYARQLRTLRNLPGNPCVIVLCHPTKGAKDINDMIPRGGGAFLNEVDGNIGIAREGTTIGAQVVGKIRGPEFPPLHFTLKVIRDHPQLVNRKGKFMPTVVAEPVSYDEVKRREATGEKDNIKVLRFIERNPRASLDAIGAAVFGPKGKQRAQRIVDSLIDDKHVKYDKIAGIRTLTPAAQKSLNELDSAVSEAVSAGSVLVPF